ncbi:MAG: cation:proton antiporter subunit C [DPANN group archaeon]|nr:cation:proton antiporter subunit C [DPANN group archaeon]
MIIYIASLAFVIIGIYTIIAKDNLVKKVIGLGIFTTGIHILLIALGYRSLGIAPIFLSGMGLSYFSSTAVDPLPQALVLTSIVIDLSVTALALTLIIKNHKMTGISDASYG